MNKYGPKARKIIEQTMEKYEMGNLKTGNSEQVVKDRKQALAVGISKARKKNYKVPPKQ